MRIPIAKESLACQLMTADELQNIVRILANSSWTRYWLNWSDSEHPVMAVQCIDFKGISQPIHDAVSRGFTETENYIYTVPRTNEDGTRYEQKLL